MTQFVTIDLHVDFPDDSGCCVISTCVGVIGEGKFSISLCASMLAVTTNRDDDSGGDDELLYSINEVF